MIDLSCITKRLLRTTLMSVNPMWVKPRDMCICITGKCNSRCITCNAWRFNKPDPSFDTLEGWIKDIADFGMKGVSISGGEPTLRKDLADIVEVIHDYGLKCGCGSNGLIIKEGLDVDSMTISIDGAKSETNDYIRGVKGGWKKAWKAVDHYKAQGVIVTLNFVLQTLNYHELPDMCKIAKEHDVKVNVLPVSLGGFSQAPLLEWNIFRTFNLDHLEQAFNDSLEVGNLVNSKEFFNLVMAKLRGLRNIPCPIQSIRFLVNSDGDVYPCSLFSEPVGSLYKNSFREIFQSKVVRELRLKCISGQCPYDDICLSQELDSCIQESFSYYFKFMLNRTKRRLRNVESRVFRSHFKL